MAIYADRIKETTTTTGTGTVTLAGAVAGYRAFSAIYSTGELVNYVIEDIATGAWEAGVGTYTSAGTTLARTTVFSSSNSGSLVNFGAGTKYVFVDAIAAQLVPVHGSELFTSSAIIPGGRLTLSSGNPVPTSNITAATTLYYTPYITNCAAVIQSSTFKAGYLKFTEISTSLAGLTANKNYDVFLMLTGSTLSLNLGAWSTDSARTNALSAHSFQGWLVPFGGDSQRYLGTIRTTGTTGQCEDSVTKRYVWNYYNRVPRTLSVTDATNTAASAGTGAWRYWFNNSANKVEFVVGRSETPIDITFKARSYSAAIANNFVIYGIGLDTVTAPQVAAYTTAANGAYDLQADNRLITIPSEGYHYCAALDFSVVNTTTQVGNGAGIGGLGLNGIIHC